MESATPAYKRIVLKLSGEALRETGGRDTISPQIVKEIARQVKEGLRPWGADLDRGRRRQHLARTGGESSRDGRTTADYMGMLATVINGLALQSQLGKPAS